MLSDFDKAMSIKNIVCHPIIRTSRRVESHFMHGEDRRGKRLFKSRPIPSNASWITSKRW